METNAGITKTYRGYQDDGLNQLGGVIRKIWDSGDGIHDLIEAVFSSSANKNVAGFIKIKKLTGEVVALSSLDDGVGFYRPNSKSSAMTTGGNLLLTAIGGEKTILLYMDQSFSIINKLSW